MNRHYRLVWNRARQLFVAASEISRGRGKAGRTSRAQRLAWLAVLPLSLSPALGMAATVGGAIAPAVQPPRPALPVMGATASPSGGQVVAGSGNISQNGLITTIDQHSQNLSLNWQSFNVGADSTVDFVQPNAQSIAVNRIADASGSVILGRLNANGQVFLINPNGVLFGQGAQVNVGGLVASTLDMSDSELASGTRHFSGNGSGRGSIVNQGAIHAAKGGYIALLGPQVTNRGTLDAPGGAVALAGGTAVTLSFDSNRLLSLQVDKSTLNALADNRQLIVADGGQVLMSAGAKDSLLASVVNNSGTIQAQTVENRAGKIVLLGGMAAGTTQVAGTLDASAPANGNGGFIETSAAHVQVADGAHVTTLAKAGDAGTWLIDPTDFTIGAGSGAMTTSSIGADTLSSNLGSGNVKIATVASGSENGDIHVNSAVSWSANELTLSAHGDININADLNGSGTAKLAFEYGQATVAGTGSGYTLRSGKVNLAAGDNFSTRQGSGGATQVYTVVTSLGVEGDATTTSLQGIGNNLAGRYVLGSDIDASATVTWNDNGDGTYAGFAPIGLDATHYFAGTLDGLGHAINGVFIDRSSTSNVGPFGYIGSTAEIRNVSLTNVHVAGSAYVGGLVGYNNGGSINNSYVAGQVAAGSTYIGGLVGVHKGSISHSYATASVTGSGLGSGGLVGYSIGSISHSYATGQVIGGGYYTGGLVAVNRGSISDSYATGTVSGGGHVVGGLVGINGQMAGDSASISNSYASGNVSGAANDVGGLAGANYTSISNSYATGTVSGSAQDVGGLVGIQYNGSISQTYATGAVNGPNAGGSVGGLVGRQNNGTISSSYWNTETTGQPSSYGGGTGLTTAALIAALPSGFATSVWGNQGNRATPYLLGNAGPVFIAAGGSTLYTPVFTLNQLQAIGSDAASLARSYALFADIDASATIGWNGGLGFDPIGGGTQFSGIFDGLGHAISGLTINRPDTDFVGLFGYASNGTIRNLGLLGGSVIGKNNVGGLVGSNVGSTITNNYATGAVTGIDSVGGLVGFNSYGGVGSGTISNSYATGAVAGGNYVGGLIGTNYRAVIDSHASGSVMGGDQIGGLVGGFQSGSINNSHATGNVTATTGASGGLVGYASATISNSYASGSVSGIYQVGGILGAMNGGSIANSYSTSTVTGTGKVGGLVGNSYYGTITNTYSSGAVSSTTDVGGLLGSSTGATVTNGYWDLTTSGQVTSAGGTGLTSLQMLTPSKFAGFNFTATPGATGNNWFSASGTRPMLASEYSTTIVNAHQLQLMAMAPAASYTLGSDIDAANTGLGNDVWGSAGFSPIGMFSGSFDGRNHVISGIAINQPALPYRGLFAYADSASSISNVGLVGGSVNGSNYAGSLAGRNEGVISNSYTTASVNGGGPYAGGLVGWLMPGGTIGNSYAAGTVASPVYAGGLVGYNQGAISNSYASGAVTGINSGGLTGSDGSGVVTNSFWNIDTTGRATSASGTGLTAAAMMQLASFSTWNIANAGGSGAVWRIYEGHTAPLLTSFMANLAVTANNVTTTYNGSAFAGSTDYTFGGLTPSQWLPSNSVDSSLLSGKVNTAAPAINAGDYALDSGLYSGQRGYDIAFTAGTLTINPAALTITTNDVSKTYDGNTTALGTATGAILGSDTLSGGTFTFDNKNAGTGKIVFVSGVTVNDGNGGNNYIVNYANNTNSQISKADLAVAGATASNRTYDGTTAAAITGATVTAFGADIVSLTNATSGSFADKNVGAGKAVSMTAGLTGADAGNYNLVQQGGLSADIAPAMLTITSTDVSKIYDGTTAASGVLVIGSGTLFGSDSLSGGSFSFTDKNAGTGKHVIASGVTANDGNGSGNYAISYVDNVTSTILAKAITSVGGLGVFNKVYDGNTAANIDLGGASFGGMIAGDDLSVGNATARFGDKSAAIGKIVTISGISLAGNDAGNYLLIDTTASTTADISRLGITVNATGADKVYDGSTVDAVALASAGVLSGDTVNFTGVGHFADKNVGNGKTVNVSGIAASGPDAGNYSYDATATTTADVTPATLTYRANSAFFWSGQVPGDLGGEVTGLVGGDTLTDATDGTLAWNTPATSASPAGEYAIDGGGLSALNYVFAQAPGNATALRVAHGSAPVVVSTVVAGLEQDETWRGRGTATLSAPKVSIVGGGVRLP